MDSFNSGSKVDEDSAPASKKLHLNGDDEKTEPENGDGDVKDGVITIPIGFVRNEWPEIGDTPKQLLFEHCKRKRLPLATFSTVMQNFTSRTVIPFVFFID